MANPVVAWFWEFGDGKTSTVQHPFHIYKEPGFYDVTLTVTFEDSTTSTKTKQSFITVFAYSDIIYDFGFNEDKKCLVYGDGKFGGNGWSIFSGDKFLYPESKAAIMDINDNSKPRTKIIWDTQSGLPFVINSDERHFTGDVFRDQVGHPDSEQGLGFPIKSQIITPSFVGDERKYRIQHEETFIDINPVRGEYTFPFPLDIDMSLFGDDFIVDTETLQDINPDGEVLFTTHKKFDRVQIGVTISESGYSISGVENFLKVGDMARYASNNVQESIAFQIYMSSAEIWLTRPNYGINRYDGTPTEQIPYNDIMGPDRYQKTGLEILTDTTFSVVGYNLALFWTKDISKIHTDLNTMPEVIYSDSTKTVWVLYKIDISGSSSFIVETDATIFDVRIFKSVLTDDKYLQMYYDDVIINQGQKFLPGYAE